MRVKKLFQDGLSVATKDDCEKAIKYIDIAMQKVLDERTKYGFYKNALEHIQRNVSNYGSNVSASESKIVDADISKEMVEYTKYNILTQASQAMLAQTKDMLQSVLEIFNRK